MLVLFAAGIVHMLLNSSTVHDAREALGALCVPYSRDALLAAVEERDYLAVKLFVEAGIDPAIPSATGVTALHVAKRIGDRTLINLLGGGADGPPN
jgi:ankyrin repeat protein